MKHTGRDIEGSGRWLTALRWGVAAAAVVGAHAATAYVLLNETPKAAPQGAEQAPILIDLAPPAAAPEIAAVEPTPEPVAEPMPEPVVEEPPTPEPEIVEPAPVPEPVVEEPEPEPVVEPPEEIPDPVEETPPEPVVEEAPPEPVVEETPPEPELPAIANAPVPTARPNPPPPRREPPRETRTAERERAEPERPRAERERPRARREAPREAERPARRQRQAAPSAASQGERRREASQGSQAAPSVSTASWQAQVQARLNRFKRPPRSDARGTARVSIALDAGGRVTSATVSRSAGNPALDEAALSLVRRASPFPAPPGGSGVTLTLPIRFN